MDNFRLKRFLALVVICFLAAPVLAMAADATAEGAQPQSSESKALEKQLADEQDEISDLKGELHEVRTITTIVLSPIALLVAILALGGSLGIVFSIRDQRRVSQLHELTVGSEALSQRRTEQTYASFLEQSQTTLSLVNDTLELAKEATDRSSRDMEAKAQGKIDEIEEQAEALMLRVFDRGDFEFVVEDSECRNELHSIGSALRALEGYLSLQKVKLPRYTKFVKAIDEFLLDDTEAAMRALRRASQERLTGDLHRFTLFWLGYMYTTVSEYSTAVTTFRDDEVGLSKDDTERFQLDCIIAETEFFKLAKARLDKEKAEGSAQSQREPWERLELVAPLLEDLRELARRIAISKDHRDLRHASLEVARTRADIYAWVAYDPERIDDPVGGGKDLSPGHEGQATPISRAKAAGALGEDGKVIEFMRSSAWETLTEPDDVRAWVHMQARDICFAEEDRNFYVEFALAEAYFMVDERKEAEDAFVATESALGREFSDNREKRRIASLEQSSLICHSRLHHLRQDDEQRKVEERRRVLQIGRQVGQRVNEMRQGRVTVFSQVQRRNVTQEEFKAEVERIVAQDRLKGEKDET